MTPSDRGSQPQQPRQSSGKLPAHVYRRRRITLGVLSLVVIGLLVLGIVGITKVLTGGGGEQTAEPAPTTVSPTPQAPVPDEKAASGACPEKAVAVSAKVDKKSYDENAKPKFEMTVANNHTATCLIEVGTKQQEFVVMQDSDVVWSSKYCAADDDENAEAPTEFAPQSQKTAQFEWNRVRVDKNCNKTDKGFAPGKYALVVKLGDKESAPAQFELEKDEATKAKEKKEAEEKKAKDEEKKKSEDASPKETAGSEDSSP
ncbi:MULTISPECIES: hypothetical protein [Brevibacterium]|uniref:Uncharacterized protein n=3 Tax=Bacteria TaxID=2 RepID=A0A2H1IU37_9MICO|nr:hypothetical protein [Brevibacterium casei]MCT1447273.1 hypothetical protein [Brevibacterium casei]MCT1550312.1 hypothetical protein [Brevibacterium casei]MCT1560581.1 hypothetical protein [Brevibacterium casei]MCT2209024.1 hypothetical protein [Brevibacterium casei]SMX78723.1 hypothetical protein BC102111_01582 [Brevibacterium casei CIP 102111]